MSLTSKERKLLDFVAGRQEVLPTAISLYRFNYRGLVTGSDMYVADALSRDHPFASAMEGHKYLEALSDLGGFTLTLKKNGAFMGTTDRDYPASASVTTDTANFPRLGVYSEAATVRSTTYNSYWGYTPVVVDKGSDWNASAVQTDVGITFSMPGSVQGGYNQLYGPHYIDLASKSVMRPVLGKFTLDSFLDTDSPFTKWVSDKADAMTSGPLNLEEMDVELGVHILHWRNGKTINVPRYAGYSTHVFMQPFLTNEQWIVWVGAVFYKWGARKDTCVLTAHYQPENPGPAGLYTSYFEFDTSIKPAGAMTALDGITQMRMYPMSGCPFFVNNYYGIAKPLRELETLTYDQRMIVKIYEQEIDVTAVRGKITFSSISNYFTHGYELFTPLVGDNLSKTLESWLPYVETGLVFGIQPGSAVGYSLKKLPFYNEYARIRSKACRDNNYMSLMYDSKYTNKQVEEMLAQASTIDVWCTNAALASTIRKDTSFSRTVLQVTKVTHSGIEMYSVRFTGELNPRRYAFNTEGAQQLLNEVIEADFGIKDNTGTLDSVLGTSDSGESLSTFDTGTLNTELSKYDMRMTSYNLGTAITAKDLESQAGVVAATAYVAQQFTLFRQVRVNIPFLISEFFFDKVWGSRIAS